MTADRWATVERLCHGALERSPAKRASYLDEACAGDAELRREVESLLAGQSAGEALLGVPALEVAARAAADSDAARPGGAEPGGAASAPLAPGVCLGPYEIETFVGAGGMGEVYRARDTRLGRMVAVKVLPQDAASDPDSRRRFESEARAASALNHPNICLLHDVGAAVPKDKAGTPSLEAEGQPSGPIHFLVMEFLEGETLAARITRGPLDIADVLDYGAQIADALTPRTGAAWSTGT